MHRYSRTLQRWGYEPDPRAHITDIIRRLYEDKNGNMWIGTNSMGLYRYDGKTLRHFAGKEGFAGNAVRGIAEDKNGNIWFGTNKGLIKYDGNQFTTLTIKDGLRHNEIWSLLIAGDGTMDR